MTRMLNALKNETRKIYSWLKILKYLKELGMLNGGTLVYQAWDYIPKKNHLRPDLSK